MKKLFDSKKFQMTVIGVLSVVLADLVLPLLGIPADMAKDCAMRIAIQIVSYIFGQAVADGGSGGATSAVSLLASKKVKQTILGVVAQIATTVFGLPAELVGQLGNIVTGLSGTLNLGQGVADALSKGRTASLPPK